MSLKKEKKNASPFHRSLTPGSSKSSAYKYSCHRQVKPKYRLVHVAAETGRNGDLAERTMSGSDRFGFSLIPRCVMVQLGKRSNVP